MKIISGLLGAVLMLVALFAAAKAQEIIEGEIERRGARIEIGRTKGSGFPATHKAYRKDLPVPARQEGVRVQHSFPADETALLMEHYADRHGGFSWPSFGGILSWVITPLGVLILMFMVLGNPFTLLNLVGCLVICMIVRVFIDAFSRM